MTVSAPQVRYTFEAIYIDANGLEIPFRAEVQFTQHLNAGAMIAAVAYAPDGIVFKNDEVATLKAHCDLWRGATIDTTNVTYAWGIKDSAVFANTTLTAEAKPVRPPLPSLPSPIWKPGVKSLSGPCSTPYRQ